MRMDTILQVRLWNWPLKRDKGNGLMNPKKQPADFDIAI